MGGSGDEEWAKVPLILRKWGGGGEKVTENLDNNSESFDKHVSPLIEFSIDCCVFGAILQFLIFDPVIVLMNVFSQAWISRSSLAIILIEEEFLFHMIYDTYHLLN